jgi:hypothetical protein
MRRQWAARGLVLALLLALVSMAHAGEGAPRPVTVGIYLNQVFATDIKGNQFAADFYIWFDWEGDDIKPLDTFELMNGRITSKSGLIKKKIGTHNYAVVRCVATVTKVWDLRRYPLDSHVLTLEVEDSEFDERGLRYMEDTDNAGISDALEIPGWAIGTRSGAVVRKVYRTNYGDRSMPSKGESAYSRYVFSLDISRPGHGRFVKVFFGLLIAVVVSWGSFFVRPKDASPRVSLGVGSAFAAAAFTVTINNSLPDTNALTMADMLVMLTLGSIVCTVAISITSLRLFALGKERTQQQLDRAAAVVIPSAYLALLIWIVT